MTRKKLYTFIDTWKKEKGTRSFHWLYKKIESDEEFLGILNSNIPSSLCNASMPQKIYHFYYDIKEVPRCRHCNMAIKFNTFSRPYGEFCNRTCSIAYFHDIDYTEINEKRRKTVQNVYGVDSPMQSQEIKDRYIKNSQDKYGVDWASKSDIVKDKIKDTWANKENKEEIDKLRTKNWQSSILKKYNKTTPFAVDYIQEKIKNIMVDLYGVEFGFQSKKIIEKGKQTCLKRYGYENAMQNDDIQRKQFLASVSLKDYILPSGVVVKTQGYNPMALDILFETYHEDDILIEFDCPKIKYKFNDNDHYYRPDMYIIKENKIIEVKSFYTFLMDIEKNIIKIETSIAQGYNFELWIFTHQQDLLKFDFKETKISNFLKSFNGMRMVYGNDFIYLPYQHIMIHMIDITKENVKGFDVNLKKNLSLSNNSSIEYINIFNDFIVNKFGIIKSRLANKLQLLSNRIYARKCAIAEVNRNDTFEFLERTHIQGKYHFSVSLGLYHHGDLVSLMTFGKKRKALGQISGEGEYELLRFVSDINTVVVGGASKLFKHFIKNYNPNKIISYADRNWSSGDLYNKLGFDEASISGPNYWYSDGKRRWHRFNFRKDKLIKDGFSKAKTERQIMLDRNYFRIYDCGNLKFEMNINRS